MTLSLDSGGAIELQFDPDAVIFISNDFEEAVNGFGRRMSIRHRTLDGHCPCDFPKGEVL